MQDFVNVTESLYRSYREYFVMADSTHTTNLHITMQANIKTHTQVNEIAATILYPLSSCLLNFDGKFKN